MAACSKKFIQVLTASVQNLSKTTNQIDAETKKNMICIELNLKKKQDLIDDEPTKKQVYLTFYRKFPKKKQEKNGLF
jgi:hypothetical protein